MGHLNALPGVGPHRSLEPVRLFEAGRDTLSVRSVPPTSSSAPAGFSDLEDPISSERFWPVLRRRTSAGGERPARQSYFHHRPSLHDTLSPGRRQTGIYHATNSGDCSWYEFAGEIVSRSGIDIRSPQSLVLTFPMPPHVRLSLCSKTFH